MQALELLERVVLDLTNTLAGDAERLAGLLEVARLTAGETDDVANLLQALIQTRSVNPPGDEADVVALLAERARGRWYAGNGRDVFHAGAVAVLTAAFAFNGLPPAIAFLAGATVSIAPLLILDDLPSKRGPRVAVLFALFAIASAPAVVDPRSIETAVDAVARALFRSP